MQTDEPGPLRVAGVQLDVAWEDPAANFERAGALALEAVAAGARLVALPEMFATGYSMNAAAVAAHADAIRAFLSDLARRHAVHVLGGFAEPGERRPFNACVLVDPEGRTLAHYRKIHPFGLAGEHLHYAGGTFTAGAVVDGVRVTPLICYDLRFPEPFRATASATDLFVVIASWPSARRGHWTALLRARAIENQAFVLGVNRVGEGDGLVYAGDSMLVDPLGAVVAARADQAGTVVGAVDAAVVADVRARFPFLVDRRPEVYARL